MIEIINLINGKFRTPKIKYLSRAIDHLNITHNANIDKLPLDTSNLESNGWLSGFTDADGHFQISLQGNYSLNKSVHLKRGRVKCTFSIKQIVIDKPPGDFCVMTEIANLFKCKIKYERENEMPFLAQADSKHNLTK